MNAELIVIIIGLILKYGVPTAIQIYQTWAGGVGDPERPTLEEIDQLKSMTPPAETFFESE